MWSACWLLCVGCEVVREKTGLMVLEGVDGLFVYFGENVES